MRRIPPALLICLFVCFAVVFLTVPLAASPFVGQVCSSPYCPGAPLYPGSTFSITLDEVGALTIYDPPYAGEVKTVLLPSYVMPGIVGIYEDHIGGELSDLLIFGITLQTVTIISDVAGYLMPDYGTPDFSLVEQGVEGYNGVLYLAGSSDLGYPGVNSYEFYSDVPEPGTLMLLGSGLIGVAGFIRRRRAT